VGSDGVAAGPFVSLFTVAPTSTTPQHFPLTLHSTYTMTSFQSQMVTSLAVARGDLQGRSLLLGTPSKVVIAGHIQPHTVLGMPPMHLDVLGGTLVNPSSFPTTYYVQYDTQQTNSTQSSTTHTTSHSYSYTESLEEKITYGLPDTGEITADLKQTGQETFQHTVTAKFNTYESQAFDVTTKTGFDDHVWFSTDRFTLYVYPVIGRLACPQS
jgi:hypothetical protein